MAVSLNALDTHRPRLRAQYTTRIRPSWRFDTAAIEGAIDYLEIRGRVRIYLSESRRGRWSGSQHWDERAGEHVVMVARWLSARAASETLWHELTHCQQVERGDTLYVDMSSSAKARLGESRYLELPGEREAAERETLAASRPLVR